MVKKIPAIKIGAYAQALIVLIVGIFLIANHPPTRDFILALIEAWGKTRIV